MSSVTSAETTSTTSTTSETSASTPSGRTSQRVDFRSASARLRENAGINDTAAVAAVTSVAAVGAAARRLRASNVFAEPAPTTTTTARRDHPSFAPPVVAPVLVPAVPALEIAVEAEVEAEVEADVEVEEPIVIDLPACEVIYLDPQIGRRKLAAHDDRELRRASLAERASQLLGTIEAAKRDLVLT